MINLNKIPSVGTKARQILDFIAASPRRFSEIQRFIVELNGLNYDEKQEGYSYRSNKRNPSVTMVKRYRGYYCNFFYGGGCFGPDGFFKNYCTKVGETWTVQENILKQISAGA